MYFTPLSRRIQDLVEVLCSKFTQPIVLVLQVIAAAKVAPATLEHIPDPDQRAVFVPSTNQALFLTPQIFYF